VHLDFGRDQRLAGSAHSTRQSCSCPALPFSKRDVSYGVASLLWNGRPTCFDGSITGDALAGTDEPHRVSELGVASEDGFTGAI
jgi:hypothetical protein